MTEIDTISKGLGEVSIGKKEEKKEDEESLKSPSVQTASEVSKSDEVQMPESKKSEGKKVKFEVGTIKLNRIMCSSDISSLHNKTQMMKALKEIVKEKQAK